jgi:prepilin-type N-terminal cleavage/methylation domain-containing protein
MSRSRRARRRGDEGFTLVEVAVTMLIMAIVATAVIATAMRAFSDTSTIVDRRDVFADGRVALDRLTKQLRQAEAIDAAWSTTQQIRFDGYLDGVETTFAWRATGGELQESRDGGTTYTTVVSSLAEPDVFTVTAHGGVSDQVTIRLLLSTRTSEVELTSDVFLRNA